MKRWMYILIGIVAIILALSAFKDSTIKFVVEKGVSGVTGLKLSMSEINVGIIKTLVDIKGLRLYNPAGFKDKIMLDMPEIYVDYDLPAVFRGKIHLKEMRINMKEFVVEKNTKGELNLDSLKMMETGEKKKPAPEPAEKKGMALQIDTLSLKVGKVLYKDYSQGSPPQVKEFAVGIDETYQNITDLTSLVSLIMVKSLAKTTISNMANFEINKLQDTITSQISSGITKTLLPAGGEAASGVEKAISGAFGGLFGSGGEEDTAGK